MELFENGKDNTLSLWDQWGCLIEQIQKLEWFQSTSSTKYHLKSVISIFFLLDFEDLVSALHFECFLDEPNVKDQQHRTAKN